MAHDAVDRGYSSTGRCDDERADEHFIFFRLWYGIHGDLNPSSGIERKKGTFSPQQTMMLSFKQSSKVSPIHLFKTAVIY